MPALFVFLLKVNLALLLFCAGYYLVLRHLTFYTLNRIYLVSAILFASVYPEINLSGFAERHQQLTQPVQAVMYRWQAPAEKLIQPLAKPDYWQWVEIAFWVGAALLATRLLMQLYSLRRLYKNSKSAQIYDHNIRIIKGNGGPFSFWKSIYVNPDNHAPAELKAILLHEQVHVNEWHTLDILLAELSTIFYWFNPGVWLMKKAVRENIEFITDQKILNKGIDSKQYQYSLLSVSFAASHNSIVNHFNISTIKKRIIMMNAKRSSGIKLTRYAFLIPAVVALLLVFSISKAALATNSHSKLAALKIKATLHNALINLDDAAKSFASDKKIKTTVAKINDTVKNGGLFVSTPEGDSLHFVINGVKATKAAFKSLNPKTVSSIDALSAADASKVFYLPGNKNTVLFVTTKGNEAGEKLKDKIDNLTFHGGQGDKSISFSGSSGDSFSNDSDSDDTSKTSTPTASNIVFIKGNSKFKAPKALTLKFDTLKFKGKFKTLNFSRTAPVVVRLSGDDTTQINGVVLTSGDSAPKAYSYSSHSHSAKANTSTYSVDAFSSSAAPEAITINSAFLNSKTSINHLQSKMIMIDGKEATGNDLKKLSASDIEGVSVQSGDEVIKKYGDKAKNGVVFIVTKKG